MYWGTAVRLEIFSQAWVFFSFISSIYICIYVHIYFSHYETYWGTAVPLEMSVSREGERQRQRRERDK